MIINPNGVSNTPKKEEVKKVEEVVEKPKADEATSILAKKLKAKGN